jgi:peroxiredoxin/predicted 2-oxoglutarate/Fe(II)-dependent dioxygenase YbiX
VTKSKGSSPIGPSIVMDASQIGPSYANLEPGDPAPWFHQRSTAATDHAFDMAAGRYIVLCFFGSTRNALGAAAIKCVIENREYFDDIRISFFGVSHDPCDEAEARVSQHLPGIRFFWDADGLVSRLYGALPNDVNADNTSQLAYRQYWLVLDPTLRIRHVIPFAPDGRDAAALFKHLAHLPPPSCFAGVELQAPILYLPDVFGRDFCNQLLDRYRSNGGREFGMMREVGGQTVEFKNHAFKRRKDYIVDDPGLIRQIDALIQRRIAPEILKNYCFKATRTERHVVGCYSAEDGGHFRAHRDNATLGTAHRRFAVSINLNSDFDGGDLSFPEYGPRKFKPPLGCAIIFPCSLLHAVSRVTLGSRYAFLPFLFDEEAARLREFNNQFLGAGVGSFQAN